MKMVYFFLFSLSSITSISYGAATATKVPFVNITKGKLLWSDEFSYNGPPDPNKWLV